MKIFIPLVAMVILSACASSQVTVTSEVTVTSPPLPTETPFPTTTPTPVAVDGVATIDGAPHIFDETAQNWVALPDVPGEYAKVMVTDDRRIVALDKDGVELYSLNMEKNVWVEAFTFEPMELSTEKIGTCDYENDIASGRLAWNVEQKIKNGEIFFPEDAYNDGWVNRDGETDRSTIFLSPDSRNAIQWVNLCKISDKFLGLPNEHSYVATVTVVNKDDKTKDGKKTYGVINYFLKDEGSIRWFKGIPLSELGPRKDMVPEQVDAAWNHPVWGDFARLYRTQGDERIRTALNQVQISGIVDDTVGKLLLHPEER